VRHGAPNPINQGTSDFIETNTNDAANSAARGRTFFFQSCAHYHGQDADGGEDAPSLLKLQISGAHMALVIQSGIKDEMPSFAKKYNEQDTAAIVAYLKTLHLIGQPGNWGSTGRKSFLPDLD
jgi:mono/diheme cytochrome c family protein